MRTWYWVLFTLYMSALVYVTFFAWNHGASLGPEGPGGRNYNLTPVRSIYRIAVFSPEWVAPVRILIGNIIMFMPLGFFLPLLFRQVRTILRIVLVGLFVSLWIEVMQFLLTYRVADVDDLILNVIGAFSGGVLYFAMRSVKRRVYLFNV
ncbi:VanZ family protein [Geomicrobium sp. JSM 1781026]|uniref:VanZ family protein n=1 Tax=unclassified Geomicrobium TaxID=2628951 RepID=UPI001EE6906E|nr:VanZ family protein [Geomicrobium sp. JCM 19037]